MDQMASAASTEGHAMLLDCRSLEHMPVPIHPDLVITVIDTGLRRELASSAFNQRRAECETVAAHFGVASLRNLDAATLLAEEGKLDPLLFARARHVVGEIARVEPVAVALARGDTATLAEVMADAHWSLSEDFAVSLPAIDQLATLVAEGLGNTGGVRLTGAGFGGCLVAVSAPDAIPAIDDAVARFNAGTSGLPARADQYRASAGAAPVRVG
jgi:galactokinase